MGRWASATTCTAWSLNLIENAISHTPPGTHVQVARPSGPADGRAVGRPTTGRAISPDMREQIFERFVRGAGDRGGSFGLGLSIVRSSPSSTAAR